MTGYQKLKAKLEIWKDYAARLEIKLLKMKVPEEVIDEERKELALRLYKLDHEDR